MRALILVLALFAAPLMAEPRQFGTVIYDLPPGWIKGRERDGYVIILSDLPDDRCAFCRLYLSTPTPLTGDLSDWLLANLGHFVDEEDRAGIDLIQQPEPTTINGTPAVITAIRTGGDLQLLMALQTGANVALIGFEGNARDAEDIEETTNTFFFDIIPVLETLRFLDGGDSGLLPPATPGDLAGIHWGFTSGLELQTSGMAEMRVRHRMIVFYPDGHFFDGTPPQGTAGLDRDALLSAGITDFGTYTRQRRNLTLSFADGTTEEFRWDGSAWVNGALNLRPVNAIPDGTPLDGGISSIAFNGFAEGSGIDGGTTRASSTTFRPDGTYMGETFGAVSATFDAGGVTTGNTTATGGRYHIENGLLMMTPDDGGPQTQSLIFRTGDEIMIDDQFFAPAE